MENLANRVRRDCRVYPDFRVLLETEGHRVSPGRKVEWGQLVPLEALVRGAATERRVLLVNPVYQVWRVRRDHREAKAHPDFRDCQAMLDKLERVGRLENLDQMGHLDHLDNQDQPARGGHLAKVDQ